jgi:hypothetical protein
MLLFPPQNLLHAFTPSLYNRGEAQCVFGATAQKGWCASPPRQCTMGERLALQIHSQSASEYLGKRGKWLANFAPVFRSRFSS